jgi:hypothetical protein
MRNLLRLWRKKPETIINKLGLSRSVVNVMWAKEHSTSFIILSPEVIQSFSEGHPAKYFL